MHDLINIYIINFYKKALINLYIIYNFYIIIIIKR